MMHSYIGYTCLAFLPCVSSDVLACVSSNACLNQQHGKKHNYSYRIGFASLPCGFQYVFSMNKRRRTESHTGCICTIFLQSGFSNVSSIGLPEQTHSHIGCISMIFVCCVLSSVSSEQLDE